MSILIGLVIIGLITYAFIRKFRRVDERLRSDAAQREARLLAAALTWKNSQSNRDSSKPQE